MSARTILVVFFALICGAALAVGVLQSNRPIKSSGFDAQETEPVLISLVDVDRGTVLSEVDVQICQWPKGLAPESALRTVEEATERAAVGQMLKGELVLDAKLAPKGAGSGLAALIPPGMRAITVTASKVAANVAGFVLPGNKVDVLLNMRGGGRGDESGGGSTTTLLQAVEVLAVDQRLEAPAENKVDPKGTTSVTLLVTPDQANMLDLGQNMGVLSLSLRNPKDESDANPDPATVAGIRFQGEAPNQYLDGDLPPPPELLLTAFNESNREPERRPASIVTLRGSHRGQVLLPGN